MMKKVLLAFLGLLGAAVAILVGGLVWAHLAIRQERAPLPSPEVISAAAEGQGRPVRLSVINTASQAMPRAAVLDSGLDPNSKRAYVMSHPSFVIEWADGRILLVDVGMTRDGAIAFGGPLETLGGALSIEPHASVAERLGDTRSRVQGLIFTHLHVDHVGGIVELCHGMSHPIPVFMTEAQAERPNYTTRSGLKLVRESGCGKPTLLTGGGPLLAVPGFPGVSVIAAGGHTPGSQIVIVHLQDGSKIRRYVLTGDIVNNIDGINYDIPKPLLYRYLVVPEAEKRQAVLRRFLRELRDRHGYTLLVSHDQRELEESGVL